MRLRPILFGLICAVGCSTTLLNVWIANFSLTLLSLSFVTRLSERLICSRSMLGFGVCVWRVICPRSAHYYYFLFPFPKMIASVRFCWLCCRILNAGRFDWYVSLCCFGWAWRHGGWYNRFAGEPKMCCLVLKPKNSVRLFNDVMHVWPRILLFAAPRAIQTLHADAGARKKNIIWIVQFI